MLKTRLTAASLATAVAFGPANQATADAKDFVLGAIIGGVVGAQIQKHQQRQRSSIATRSAPHFQSAGTRAYSGTRAAAPRATIPATEEGETVQNALNYFGFDAGRVDGRVGPKTRSAISDYQSYMGYPTTGTLNNFEQELLVTSFTRAQAGGRNTFAEIAAQPDGARGLLKLYRDDLAGIGRNDPTSGVTGSPTAVIDL